MTEDEEKRAAYKEKLRSIGFRPTKPSPKVIVDRTDTAFVTTTEHWEDRQDVNVKMTEPVKVERKKEDG